MLVEDAVRIGRHWSLLLVLMCLMCLMWLYWLLLSRRTSLLGRLEACWRSVGHWKHVFQNLYGGSYRRGGTAEITAGPTGILCQL